MGNTIPGGCYVGTDGEYHDANGNKLKAAQVEAAEELAKEKEEGAAPPPPAPEPPAAPKPPRK